jgi:hypothetical protein
MGGGCWGESILASSYEVSVALALAGLGATVNHVAAINPLIEDTQQHNYVGDPSLG